MTIEELEKRVADIEQRLVDLSKRVLGERIRESKIGDVFKSLPGERVKTGGYIQKVEHKEGKKGAWQNFKLCNGEGNGVFVKHFGTFPEWASDGVACTVDELSVELWNGKNTYTIRKWGPYVKPQTQSTAPPVYRPVPPPEQPVEEQKEGIPF